MPSCLCLRRATESVVPPVHSPQLFLRSFLKNVLIFVLVQNLKIIISSSHFNSPLLRTSFMCGFSAVTDTLNGLCVLGAGIFLWRSMHQVLHLDNIGWEKKRSFTVNFYVCRWGKHKSPGVTRRRQMCVINYSSILYPATVYLPFHISPPKLTR